MTTDNYNQFVDISYNGRALLNKHSLNETGLWHIFGEDPNCDLPGSHVQPDLGFVEGKLGDAIEYAINLPGFWQWGAGGNIKKVENVHKVSAEANARLNALRMKKKELEKQISDINTELKGN